MAVEGWISSKFINITMWISTVSGPKVTESMPFLFVDATFHSGDMRCRERKSRKEWSKILRLIAPNLGDGPNNNV